MFSVHSRGVVSWLLVAVLLFVIAPRHALADVAGGSTATVISPDGLNLRLGPSTAFTVVALIPAGTQVTIMGPPTPDNWLPVQYNAALGWADGTFLLLNQPGSSPPPAPPVTATVIPPDGLNLRSAPSMDTAVLTILPGGATVLVTGASSDGWLPVTYDGVSGWADGDYLSMQAGASPAGGPATTSAAVASSGGAAVSTGASPPPPAALYGTAAMGARAPAESGLTITTAPPGTLGRFVWPVDSRRITTLFQPRHEAIDIDQGAGGNPVRAIADGTVSFAGGDPCCSYGLYVIVQHADGFSSLYAHLSSLEVKQGQAVRQSQELGRSGSTGRSTGPHVHFAIYAHGMPLDPLSVLPSDGVQIWPGANTVS